MEAMVSWGALRWGQWPVASISTSVLSGTSRATYSPTTCGAMTSSAHWSTRVGALILPSTGRASLRKVVRAKTRATSGSMRQKASVSSWPTWGRSGLPAMTGAIAALQPR